ncbi:MAG TPA: hypothetical protein VGX68_13055 [Thermoanaerobaculia bacterium]|jgi:hypothetical protein|nr:hypothetical protein [Thermoanaerobaculia bacterium]
MATERWREIEAIFAEVAALPAGERADRLRLSASCAGRPVRQTRTRRLLAFRQGR